MSSTYKPATYNSVSPYLVVDGASATIDFLKRVFQAVELHRISADDGTIRHAEVRIDDTVIMLADSIPGWPAVPAHLHVFVADVDATYQRALEANAVSVQAPLQKDDDEDKRGGVKDVTGITWWIATRVA